MYRLRAEESARQGDGTGAMSSALKAIACERMADGLAAVGEPAFTIGGEVHYQGGDCCRVIGQRCSCRGRLHVHHPSGGGARYVCEDCGAET